VKQQATGLSEAIREGMKLGVVDASKKLPSAQEAVKKLYERLEAQFDKRNGGFGGAPKFPKPGMHSL